MSDSSMPPSEPLVVDCEATVHQLYHYLDGELTEERRLEIRQHLDHCGPCVDVVQFESELRRVVADRCRDRVPPELIERIAELIHHESNENGSSAT